jgi:GT2 family glycosyltransferase
MSRPLNDLRCAVSFVVPTYRRPEILGDTLRALLEVDYPVTQYEVIVVDDGSEDLTASVVRALRGRGPEITYVGQVNRGAATARNRGAMAASGELLVFCDDDMLVEPSHVVLHLRTRASHGECAVNGERWFSPRVEARLRRTPFGRFRLDLEREYLRPEGVRLDETCIAAHTLSACNLAVRRELFAELGGFDPDLPYPGAEDQEFSLRASRAGCLLVRNRAIRMLHNDPILTLPQFCAREERGAFTVGVLAAKHPETFGRAEMVIRNGPIRREDSSGLLINKLVKRALSGRASLTALDTLVAMADRKRLRGWLSERRRRRVYSALLAFHIFRGLRAGLTSALGDNAWRQPRKM